MFKCRAVLVILGQVVLIVMSVGQATACMGPSFEDHHFPSCAIPAPDISETVTVISAGGFLPSATVNVGEPTKETAVATINIEPSDHKHYLVLQSGRQIIWNIEGDTDSVSRVVVLGATWLGPWAAGVIGVPEQRIHFTAPDLSVFEQVPRTSCTRIAHSCIASQWFGTRSDQANFHPPSDNRRLRVDAFVSRGMSFGNSDSRIVVGGISYQHGVETGKWPVTMPNVAQTTVAVAVDPEKVVAPRGAAYYDQPTGQAGLDRLVQTGALIAAGNPQHAAEVMRYAEAFSSRYRSRFDPDYYFVPQVDYLVTRPMTLPADIPARTFLLGSGVPLPKFNGNDDRRTCFLAMDRASESVQWKGFQSHFCREGSRSRHEPDVSVFRAAQSSDSIDVQGNCRQASFPMGTEIVVVSVIETGRKWRRGDPPRPIEIDVNRNVPVVLYLQNSGGAAQWTLSGAGIQQVFMLRPSEQSLNHMKLNGEPYSWTRLGIDKDDCPLFAPYQMELRGPTYLHLDKMIKALLGKPIDRLIEVQAGSAGPIQIVAE